MTLLFLQTEIGWEKWIGEGVAVMLVVIFLGFLIKALPTWKDLKIEEFKVRTKEAEASGQIAGSLVQLANVQNELGETIKNIAIEQRRATDNVLILQRVNANESQNISETVDNLIERIDTLEENLKDTNFYATRPKAITNKRN